MLMHEEVLASVTAVRRSNKKRFTWIAGIVALALVVAIALTIIIVMKKQYATAHPLAGAIQTAAGFPLYYPTPLPAGYTYKKGSARVDNGIVFYTLQNGSKTTTINEQATPQNPPDLSHLTGFTNMQTLAGNTAVGSVAGKPVAIILSNTTLITINGSSATPSDTVTIIARSMTSLGQ